MSRKIHRSGGKFGKQHGTFTPMSGKVADGIVGADAVKRLVSSKITCPGKKNSSFKRIKVFLMKRAVLVKVSDGSMTHEIWVYGTDGQDSLRRIVHHIEEWCRVNKIQVTSAQGPSPP